MLANGSDFRSDGSRLASHAHGSGPRASSIGMGLFKSLFGFLGGNKKQVRILTVGLDNSGKSTIIAWMKPKKVRSGARRHD